MFSFKLEMGKDHFATIEAIHNTVQMTFRGWSSIQGITYVQYWKHLAATILMVLPFMFLKYAAEPILMVALSCLVNHADLMKINRRH